MNTPSSKRVSGLGAIIHGVGTTRNAGSIAHGTNDGDFPPEADVAQLINHLAGSSSVFVLKQTKKLESKRVASVLDYAI
ncbi:abortive infection family protein [Pseudomonas sp. NPDC096917]|uniref:abortive infection family protein n=1 Tax=Pseudomonas sp. NPDC096917 TaxID=3364483 RepID=UPI00383B5854